VHSAQVTQTGLTQEQIDGQVKNGQREAQEFQTEAQKLEPLVQAIGGGINGTGQVRQGAKIWTAPIKAAVNKSKANAEIMEIVRQTLNKRKGIDTQKSVNHI
jgi:hypothetical protein